MVEKRRNAGGRSNGIPVALLRRIVEAKQGKEKCKIKYNNNNDNNDIKNNDNNNDNNYNDNNNN